MTKININYAKANKSAEIGYFLSALGFRRTDNAYWVEVYRHQEADTEVNLYLEECKPETPAKEWQHDVINAIGLTTEADADADKSSHKFWTIAENGEILHILPESAEFSEAWGMIDDLIEYGHYNATVSAIYNKMQPEEPEAPETPETVKDTYDFGDSWGLCTKAEAEAYAQNLANSTGKTIKYFRDTDGIEFTAEPEAPETMPETAEAEEAAAEKECRTVNKNIKIKYRWYKNNYDWYENPNTPETGTVIIEHGGDFENLLENNGIWCEYDEEMDVYHVIEQDESGEYIRTGERYQIISRTETDEELYY